MSQCFRCGVSGERAKLYDVLSNRGVIKLCESCNHIEHLPLVRRPSEAEILDSKNPMSKSVRDRLNAMKGIKPSKPVTLRQLIDKDYEAKKSQPPADLIPNFNWAIQRIRRNRKISREQFAKGIGESESTVRMIEQGYFPDSSDRIVGKIEAYLGISLRKSLPDYEKPKKFMLDESMSEKVEEAPKIVNIDKEATKKLTIRDLLGIKKKQQDDKSKKMPIVNKDDDYPMDDEQFLDNPDNLSEEED